MNKTVNRYTNLWKCFLVTIVTAMIACSGRAFAAVPINYPNYINNFLLQDRALPGSPSKNIADYQKELVVWAQDANIPLTAEMAATVIGMPYTAEATTPITYSFTAENGSTTNGTYFDINAPIWHTMRDLVFLQTMQHSVAHWNNSYINPIGNSIISLSGAFSRAQTIQNEFNSYISDGFFSDSHNPLVTAVIGPGSTSYANALTGEGALDISWNGLVSNAMEANGSSIIKGENFLSDFSIFLDSNGISSFTASQFTQYFVQRLSAAAVNFMGVVTTGAQYSVVKGGIGAPFLAGTIVSSALNYIADGLADASKGAHLVNYYYLSKKYPSTLISSGLLENEGVINFVNLNLFTGHITTYDESDIILNALTRHPYEFDGIATNRQIQAAYGIANLLQSVESMDFPAMKQEMAAYAYLTYLKQHSFSLNMQRVNATANSFDISLPGSVINDADHGGPPANISWYQTTAGYFQTPIDEASFIDPVRSANNQVTQFQFSNQSIGKDVQIDVTVRYADDFTKTSRLPLTYLPQHSNVSLAAVSSPVIQSANNIFRATIDPDTSANINYKTVKLYQQKMATASQPESFDITSLNHVSGNNHDFTFAPDSAHYSYIEPGQYQYWLNVDGLVSSKIEVAVVDPDDVDGDGLPDWWEIQYFSNLNQAANDDYDSDGFTNLSEYKDSNDPTKPGALGFSDFGINGQTITGNVRWSSAHNYLVTGGVTVAAGATLTIPSGVIVKMKSGSRIQVSGTLNASGVTFTWDGTTEWNGIMFSGSGSSASRLDGCIVEHVQSGLLIGAIHIDGSSPTIIGTTVRNSSHSIGIHITNGSPAISNSTVSGFGWMGIFADYNSSPVITGSTISSNGDGIFLQYSKTTQNRPVFKGNTYTANTNGLIVTGEIGGVQNWDNTYDTQITHNGFQIPSGVTLTIDSGKTLKGLQILMVYGTLNASGVTFTWNGTTEWSGIAFSGSGSSASHLDGCIVEHVQSGGLTGAIHITGSSPTINGTTVRSSSHSTGIYINNGSPAITNSTISGFGAYGIFADYNSSPVITGCNFTGNNYAVVYSGTTPINATNNNWGDPSGPLDSSDDRASGGLYNPAANGNMVSDNVNYYPWVGSLPAPPDTPSGLHGTPGNAALNVSWEAANGAASYKVYYGTASSSYGTPQLISGTTTSINGLTNGVSYFIAVTSLNNLGVESTKSTEIVLRPSAIPQSILSVSVVGNGSGSVASSPSGIACTSGICSAQFDTGALITLSAPPDVNSFFSGWSGACTGTGTCQVTMDAAKSVTATFVYKVNGACGTANGTTMSSTPTANLCIAGTQSTVTGTGPWYWSCAGIDNGSSESCSANFNTLKVKLDLTLATYTNLQDAYNSASDNESFLMQAYSFQEHLILNKPINVKFYGGKDTNYSGRIGVTTIEGSLTIEQGSVEISDLVIW